MAYRSRREALGQGVVVFAAALAAALLGASPHSVAAGLPMRDAPAPENRAFAVLSENLRFKLARADAGDDATWAALVNETVLIGQRLGLGAAATVAPSRRDGVFYAEIAGRGLVAGRDPDRVLGRLLYMLASGDPRAAAAAPIAISDQALTATLTTLTSTLR